MYREKARQLNMKLEDYKKILTLFNAGSFPLNVPQAANFVNLHNKIVDVVKKMEAEPKEEQSKAE